MDTVVTNTSNIQRGYKAGYSIIETDGLGNVNGGNGGNGLTGGRGGIGGDGGGYSILQVIQMVL